MEDLFYKKFKNEKKLERYIILNEKSLLNYVTNLGYNIEKCGFCDNYSMFKIKWLIKDDKFHIDKITYPFYCCNELNCPGKKLHHNSKEFLIKGKKFTEIDVNLFFKNKSQKGRKTLQKNGYFDDISNNPYSKEFWIKKGLTEEEAQLKLNQKGQKSVLTKMINGHFDDISNNPYSKEFWIKKGLTEEEAQLKIKHKIEKGIITKTKNGYFDDISNNPYSKEFWIKKGLTEDEAQVKVNQRNMYTTDYWKYKGYDENNANKLSKKSANTRSLNSLQLKYGMTAGIDRYNEIRKKSAFSCSIEGMMQNLNKSKSEVLQIKQSRIDKINFSKTIQSIKFKYNVSDEESLLIKNNSNDIESLKIRNISKKSLKLFKSLFDKLPNDLQQKCYFGKNEFGSYDKLHNKYYYYDFVISNLKICIEFNGLKFHPKDISDTKWKQLYTNKTSTEVYNHDYNKKQILLDRGFDYYVIWEDEINENTINYLQTIINKKYQLWKQLN